MSDLRDGGYYRSAGYVAADGGYVDEAASQSSFEGESGFYAATFHNAQLWVMNSNYEWIDPSSGDVLGTGPREDDDATSRVPNLFATGAKDPTDYGIGGDCLDFGGLLSRVTNRCYDTFSGDIQFYSNEALNEDRSNEIFDVVGGECDSLLTVDSQDNFYCVEELGDGQQWLIRIDGNTGEALAITPETDQAILQAVVSSDEEQVLFTASRDEYDPLTAYAVSAAGGTEPRELSALTGQLEDQSLYSWTANTGRPILTQRRQSLLLNREASTTASTTKPAAARARTVLGLPFEPP